MNDETLKQLDHMAKSEQQTGSQRVQNFLGKGFHWFFKGDGPMGPGSNLRLLGQTSGLLSLPVTLGHMFYQGFQHAHALESGLPTDPNMMKWSMIAVGASVVASAVTLGWLGKKERELARETDPNYREPTGYRLNFLGPMPLRAVYADDKKEKKPEYSAWGAGPGR